MSQTWPLRLVLNFLIIQQWNWSCVFPFWCFVVSENFKCGYIYRSCNFVLEYKYSVLFLCFSYPWCGACWRSLVNRRAAKDSCCPGFMCGYFLLLCVPQAKANPEQMARFLEDREQGSFNQSSQVETVGRVQKADPVSGKASRRQLHHAALWGPNHRRRAFLL